MNKQAGKGKIRAGSVPRRARALALAASMALALGSATLGGGITPARAASCTSATEYDYTGATQCFVVPAGVTSVTFDVYGAQGGNGGSNGASGGLGAEVKGTFAASPGEPFSIAVGGAGANGVSAQGSGSPSVSGGWNGGGSGGGSNGTVTSSGGGGGGMSEVIINSNARLLITAAGGGGGGGWGGGYPINDSASGGAGGAQGAGQGLTGWCQDSDGNGGSGGTTDQGGRIGGTDGQTEACPGGGGGLTGGGKGGYTPDGGVGQESGADGNSQQGGTGGCKQPITCIDLAAALTNLGGGGGGGGAGVYGGGGGSTSGAGWVGDGAGGGGGSSFIDPAATTASVNPGVQSSNGKVLISYASGVSLTSSTNPAPYYTNPTYTAQVTPATSAGAVSFTEDGYPMQGCSDVAVSNGVASCAQYQSTLRIGAHQIVATYHGSVTGQGQLSGSSSALSQVVKALTTTTLTVTTLNGQSGLPAVSGQPVVLSAALYAIGAPVQTPAGPVSFYANGVLLGTTLPQSTSTGTALATLPVTSLPVGTQTLTATYQGDSTTEGSTSGQVNQAVKPGSFLNDTAAGITFSGDWGYSNNRSFGDYLNDEHYTQTNGDSFGYTFTGTGVQVIGETNAGGGSDEVYVDGKDKGSISTYNATSRLPQQVLYSISGLASGSHTLKVVKTSGGYFELDALAIMQ